MFSLHALDSLVALLQLQVSSPTGGGTMFVREIPAAPPYQEPGGQTNVTPGALLPPFPHIPGEPLLLLP